MTAVSRRNLIGLGAANFFIAIGGVVAPLVAGFVEAHLGFRAAFSLFSAVAECGTLVLLCFMPETGRMRPQPAR